MVRTGAGLGSAEALDALYRAIGLPFQPCPCPAYVPVPGERLQVRLRWTPPPGARPHDVVWRETTALRRRSPATQGDTPAQALAAFVSTNR